MKLRQILNSVRRVRVIIQEMRQSRERAQEMESELLLLKAVIQRLADEVRKLREELAGLRAWTQAEHENIRRRLELIEQGLPAEKSVRADKDDEWVM
ncbi:MAG: hypothetical protein U0Z53_20885 [Blastocatellia bacterium]